MTTRVSYQQSSAWKLNVGLIDISVQVGELPIQLQTDDPEFQRTLCERYGAFARTGTADRKLKIALAPVKETWDADADVSVQRSEGAWHISRGDFEAEWEPSRGEGWVRQTANPYSIDTVLRIIHTLELAKEGGFLLHSSSVIRNGRAFLFSGISGAGKTTISRLAPPDTILLTDEISYVRPEGRTFRAYGTPFAGELAKPGEDVSAPIGEVYLLAQGPENRLDDVPPVTAARALLRNILFFAEDPGLIKALLETACEFVSRVPVRRLVFYPDQRVWDLIG